MIKEHRPWGFYEILYEDDKCKVKKITVKPKQRLSLQSHSRRKELWNKISGEWLVEISLNNHLKDVGGFNYVFIDKNRKHRVINTSDTEDLVFIEIQTGDYFGEDDIIRYEDDYNRIEKGDK